MIEKKTLCKFLLVCYNRISEIYNMILRSKSIVLIKRAHAHKIQEVTPMNKELQNHSYTMETSGKIGEVKIADDVVATIAGLAATEVEGVAAMSGNLTNEIVGKLGMKNLSKGVKIEVIDKAVTADLSITMKYGYSIPKTSKTVQDKVKTAIENMTGLTVSEVNIRIVGVDIENTK